HHHSRPDAFAFHVRHYYKHRVGTQRDEIVVITTAFERRFMRNRNIEAGQGRRSFRQYPDLTASRERQIALHPLLRHHLAVKLRVFESQGDVIGNVSKHRRIPLRERTGLFVQKLQNAGGVAVFVANRQAKQRARPKPQPNIDLRFKSRVRVRVSEIPSLPGLCPPSRDSARHRQTDFVLIESSTDERPDFVFLMVHQEDSAALRAGLPHRELKNDVQKFGKIQRRVETLRRFDDRRKFDDGVAAFAALKRHSSIAAEEVEPAARVDVQLAFKIRFKNTQQGSLATEQPRLAFTIRARNALATNNLLDPLGIRGRKIATFFPHGWSAIYQAPQPRAIKTPRTCEHLNHLGCE